MATVDISILIDKQNKTVCFFIFLIFDKVSDGGRLGCRSRYCSLRLCFKSFLLTNNIIDEIIGPVAVVLGNTYLEFPCNMFGSSMILGS
jgi:hypothetical protein